MTTQDAFQSQEVLSLVLKPVVEPQPFERSKETVAKSTANADTRSQTRE